MIKNKRILLIIILVVMLFLIQNICNATTTYTSTSTTSTGKTVNWSYELDANNNIVNLKCTNISEVSGSLEIPSTIDGHTVKTIGHDAFAECVGLTAVTIPNTVTTIDYSAFYKCTGLRQITVPDSVTTIGMRAFQNCSGLTSVTLSSQLTSIKDHTFENCTGLTNVIIPNSVTTIEGDFSTIYGAFGGCKNLAKVLIPDTVASIGNGAFRDCPKLTIYGHDGQVSKTYADEKNIKFDYIENWDNEGSGKDITAPTVDSIYIKYSSVVGYWDNNTNTHKMPANSQIIIIVDFSEKITGSTVPTLTIKCGTGEDIKLTEGTILESSISYAYTIKSTDIGLISSVSLIGGNITDLSGNVAKLSCPDLGTQYSSFDTYADGNLTAPENTQNLENNNSSVNGSDDMNSDKDPTTASGILPQTGTGIILLISIIVLAIILVITYKKYNGYKDIK